MPRTIIAVTVLLVAGLTTAGCGFIASGGDGPTGKPDTFPLHGYVSVAGVPGGADGTTCTAPASHADIHAGGSVRVADPSGHTLGTGQLDNGVIGPTPGGAASPGGASPGPAAAHCNFGFEVRGVRGGVSTYVIGVGNRPEASFPAHDLRENKQAVISVDD